MNAAVLEGRWPQKGRRFRTIDARLDFRAVRVIARRLSREQSVIVEGREWLVEWLVEWLAKEQPDKRDRNNRYTYPRIKGSPCAL